MSYVEWLAKIRSADKSSAIQGTVRKVHYTFQDGTEMAEEYSTETGCVLRRAWKVRSDLLRKDDWEIELGEPIPKALKNGDEFALQEAATEPLLSKRVTRNCIEWRIRNLPYPLSTYTITCEGDARTITVRTSNKKYFKKIVVPEFQRCNFPPKVEDLMVKHQYNTLIISYKKPPILVEMEKATLTELQSVETVEYDNIQCGDLLKGLIGG
ncbi:protein DPCD [Aedes albopictus]|uniref:Protein DPCD n=1 Tax=Aedes albopictus TaxID=7160 RepID=A0ABM1YNW1_AEDAL